MYMDQDNIPFYVGKGNGDRFRVCHHLFNKNLFLKNKIRKVGADNIKTHFLHENLIEEKAFFWEKYWIKYLGRRDNGTGQLCNLTDGGEGPSGIKCSEDHKRKISEAMKGKKLSKEHRRKLSKSLKGNQRAKGLIHSEEAKRKIGNAQKGNQHTKGFIHSDETKRKMSDARKLYLVKKKK